MYYVFIENNKINGKGQCLCEGDGIQCVEVSQEIYENIDHYIWDGNKLVDNPNYEHEQYEKELERVRQERAGAFSEEADPLKFNYEEDCARYGEDSEQAQYSKEIWLAKKDEIRQRYPYPTESEN